MPPPRSSLRPNLGVRTLPSPPQIQESRTPAPIDPPHFETGSCVPSLTLEVQDPEGRPRLWVPELKASLSRCPAGSGSLDYMQGNLVRLGLAGLVLISLGTLVVFDWRSQGHAPRSVRP